MSSDGYYSQVGTGGHGGSTHATSSGWQSKESGHRTPSQGSLHLHSGQPSSVRAKPWGQNIRHVCAAHGFGSAVGEAHNTIFVRIEENPSPEQLTCEEEGALVPATSKPASSTHQQLPSSSFSHWTLSKPPFLLHRGALAPEEDRPRDLARLVAATLTFSQPEKKRKDDQS